MKEKLQIIVPEVVISDYVSGSGAVMAKELGIPAILNFTFPLKYFTDNGHDVISMRDACSCCGMLCLKRSCMRAFVEFYTNTTPYYKKLYQQ